VVGVGFEKAGTSEREGKDRGGQRQVPERDRQAGTPLVRHSALGYRSLESLQRSVGNRAVVGLLSPPREATVQRLPEWLKKLLGKKNDYQEVKASDADEAEAVELHEEVKEGRGPLIEKEAEGAAKASEQIGEIGNALLTFGTNMAVDKAVGDNLKQGLPMSIKRKLLLNVGQFVVLAGDVVGLVPVIGEAGAAPLTFAGTTAANMGKGYTKKQATAIATHVTGVSAATGAIPFAGTAFSVVGLANDVRDFCTPVATASKIDAIAQMRKTREKLGPMLERCRGVADALQANGSPMAPKALKDVREMEELLEELDHYIKKYDRKIERKMDEGTAGLIKYADYELEKDLV
jgi:hypothetical protein